MLLYTKMYYNIILLEYYNKFYNIYVLYTVYILCTADARIKTLCVPQQKDFITSGP